MAFARVGTLCLVLSAALVGCGGRTDSSLKDVEEPEESFSEPPSEPTPEPGTETSSEAGPESGGEAPSDGPSREDKEAEEAKKGADLSEALLKVINPPQGLDRDNVQESADRAGEQLVGEINQRYTDTAARTAAAKDMIKSIDARLYNNLRENGTYWEDKRLEAMKIGLTRYIDNGATNYYRPGAGSFDPASDPDFG